MGVFLEAGVFSVVFWEIFKFIVNHVILVQNSPIKSSFIYSKCQSSLSLLTLTSVKLKDSYL